MLVGNKPPAAAAEIMKLVELHISWLLLGGVVASMATVLVGLVLTFVQHPDFLRPAADVPRHAEPGEAFPHTLGQVFRGVAAGSGQAVMVLGLCLLVATPILRVAISLAGFVVQRDYTYTAITAVVLIVLLMSFLLGKVD
jgi:uncharacterized membrane protein